MGGVFPGSAPPEASHCVKYLTNAHVSHSPGPRRALCDISLRPRLGPSPRASHCVKYLTIARSLRPTLPVASPGSPRYQLWPGRWPGLLIFTSLAGPPFRRPAACVLSSPCRTPLEIFSDPPPAAVIYSDPPLKPRSRLFQPRGPNIVLGYLNAAAPTKKPNSVFSRSVPSSKNAEKGIQSERRPKMKEKKAPKSAAAPTKMPNSDFSRSDPSSKNVEEGI